jgi:hypothetical protein
MPLVLVDVVVLVEAPKMRKGRASPDDARA